MTILSGDIGVTSDSSDNVYHVVNGSGTDDSAVFDGFTITAGNGNGDSSPNSFSGGILIAPGSPIVSNCTFTQNMAGSGGGMAIAGVGADPTVTNCTFIDNTAVSLPGTLSGGGGGGICILEYASVTVTYCTFDSNFGHFGGGIAVFNESSAIVTHCLFTGNTSGRGGGLFNNYYTSVTLSNCTFSDNTAIYGGGIDNTGSNTDLTAIHCTFSENTAYDRGGGISTDSGATTALGATIVANNSAAVASPDIYGAVVSSGYNLIGDTTGCTGLASTDLTALDPLLGPLADKGGATLTYSLLLGSRAIDAVPCATFPSITTDQRGVTRPMGDACDIGAYEAVALGDINGDGATDVLDVRLCIQIALGVIPGTAAHRQQADMNGDGQVTLTDAQLLADYTIGISH